MSTWQVRVSGCWLGASPGTSALRARHHVTNTVACTHHGFKAYRCLLQCSVCGGFNSLQSFVCARTWPTRRCTTVRP